MGLRDLTRRVEQLEKLLGCKSVTKPPKSIDAPGARAAYRLRCAIPGCEAGTVFVHNDYDGIFGSVGCGALRNAWDRENCQGTAPWCGGTHTLPGQLRDDTGWFERVPNDGRYYVKPGK